MISMAVMINKRMFINVLIVAVLFAAVSTPPTTEAAVTCGTVVQYLSDCLPYVTNRGPLGGCCVGVRQFFGTAVSTRDRQAACGCLKTMAGSYAGINYGKVAGIPAQCGVRIPYRISPSTDCSRVR